MSDFEQAREELSGQRQKLLDGRQKALLAHEAVKRAERELEIFSRTKDREGQAEQARLEKALKTAQENEERAIGDLAELKAKETQLLETFQVYTDPREQLGQWSDRFPILLFPLRLETRFKTTEGGQPQLWVRVYPDTCLVDTFEESLTEQEVTNARNFWAAVWRAGGDETLERAAWRDLIAAHGSGRAGWIIRKYQPLNPNEKPLKDSPSEILLIIPAPQSLPVEALAYWMAVWRAGDDAGAQEKAYRELVEALGEETAQQIVELYQPVNLSDSPAAPQTRKNAQVKVTVLQLTPPESLQTRRTSWSSAARIDLLPDRFVLVAYEQGGSSLVEIGRPIRTPLRVGPDPNAPQEQQLKPDEDTLQIPDELAWMFDFEKALEVGMAFRVDLNTTQAAAGFERVIVLGLRFADSMQVGQQNLARLLEHHLHSRAGLEILPQGTPTNNTEKGGSGYSFRENPEATFDVFFKQKPQYDPRTDPLVRRDGQWLEDALGIEPGLMQQVPNAGNSDQSEARAMQIALWPGTLGYMMTTLLAPVFSSQDIANTRRFFTRYVSGRGPLPALRIGNQPYGILPVTAFNRLNGFAREKGYLGRLYAILKRMDEDWKPLLEQVSYIGKPSQDPHQTLLDVLGLHPGSVEYYPLQADSVESKFYELAFLDFSIALELLGLFPAVAPFTLLRSFGYTGADVPDLLNKVYRARQTPLDGPIIDDRPLSETEAVRKYAGTLNYIEWLAAAAKSGIEQIQQEQGFDGNKKPNALLYLLLRHALQLGFHATGVSLQAGVNEVVDTGSSARESAFVHVAEVKGSSESRYGLLFSPADQVTGQAGLPLGDYIAHNWRVLDPELREQIEALERLSPVSTARLERLFAEHIDTCSYRLDAWKMGLLALQLERMRQRSDLVAVAGNSGGGEPIGIFLGAYGWLEPLRPEDKVLTPVELPKTLSDEVNRRDTAPLMRDSTNLGLIHAPSVNQATTAAVLRNGYVAHEGQLAVNLSARRVRLALGILEGMRNGQSLGALLGYQFERHVHDNGPLQVRDLIYHMRRAFPLVANQIEKTKTEAGEAQESITAMNVVDGRKLVEHVEGNRNFTYPFGVDTLPRRTADQEDAITHALAYIRNINDAVADLMLAEGVYQAVSGNFDRSAGTLDAFAKGNYPPEPEVIRTPRSGIALTLRTAIHLSPAPAANPLPAIALTPLANAEPALNAWLAGRLPRPADVGCEVSFIDRATNAEPNPPLFISQEQLGLQPIDLVYRAEIGTDQALKDLDDRILKYLYTHHTPRFDRPIRIQYTKRVDHKVSWFELQALLRSLRAVVSASRSLQPADLMRQNDAAQDEQSAVTLAKSRVQSPRDDLQNVHVPALDTLMNSLNDPTITMDAALAEFATTVEALAAYRLPQTGIGFIYEWRTGVYSAVAQKVAERVKLWNNRLDRYLNRIQDYDQHTPPTEAERIAELQAAEILIRTYLTSPVPPSGDYRNKLDDRETDFKTKRDALQKLVDTARATLAQLVSDAQGEITGGAVAFTDIDSDALDFGEQVTEIARFRDSLKEAVARLKEDLSKRIQKVDALLSQYDPAGTTDKVKLLQEAAKILFGEDFQMVPQITLPASAASELANAWQHFTSGALTKYLTDGKPAGIGRDFPVDDWLHGVARVREKMHHWENILLLGEAFQVSQAADLTPLQLPYRAGESWLALEIPEKPVIDSDRLLYTAHFAEPFDQTRPICGLLMDEWTEVIPGTQETTGIAFHFDRPNAEPPQTWLLALPAIRDGAWSWDELLAAINDTLDSAKRRAIEPVHVDDTAYSAFLPATMSAYTFPEISISNNLLRNVQIYARLVME
jgi:hypothetical protein